MELPLFPITAVGSFPKSPYLNALRRKYTKGEISAEELKEKEQTATKNCLLIQDFYGLDVLCDGELYRGDMAAFFAEHFTGFKEGKLVKSYGNGPYRPGRYYKKPIINGRVEWTHPVILEWHKFAQAQTEKPVKAILTGPYTMYHWSDNQFYTTKEHALEDLAIAVRKEVEELYKSGARFIQLDEPAASAVPEDLGLVKTALEIVTDGFNDAKFFSHMCYGHIDELYPKLLELPIHNFDLEIKNRGFYLYDKFKAQPFTKELSLGVVDVHTPRIESHREVELLIEQALTIIPKEKLWISPDCGLKTRSWEEATAKLKVIKDVVTRLRGKHATSR